jgi:hypothetical protein
MLKSTPAEWLLARLTDPTRAAAILGDLTEMAATRGRLWFYAAYARTLFSLTWRIVLALFVADIGRQLIFDLFHLYISHTPTAWRNTTGSWLELLNSSGPLLACIMSTLWFALPFAAVRYGVRDRFVQLTAAVALGTTLAFLCIPWASFVCAVATMILAAAALISRSWRKPLEVLLWTGAAGLSMIAVADTVRLRVLVLIAHSHSVLAGNAFALLFQTGLLALAFVCSRLHAPLLREPPQPTRRPPSA